jgi:outer membrane protein assembly factor BamE (lipoprotein component of BamABCDE complex)
MPALPGTDVFNSPRQIRGHQVDDEDLRQITAGVSTRSDVTALLGSPTATGTFDDSEWYYISGVTRQRPARTLTLEDQSVVVVRFDPRGTVQEVRRVTREEGQDVRFVQRETPSPGTERTLLQQLFGNIGRLGPGLGNQPTGGPGSPTPSGR